MASTDNRNTISYRGGDAAQRRHVRMCVNHSITHAY